MDGWGRDPPAENKLVPFGVLVLATGALTHLFGTHESSESLARKNCRHTIYLSCRNAHAAGRLQPAALFIYSLTVISYNILQVVLTALFATHEEEEVNSISGLYISKEIASVTPGMLIALDDEYWEQSLSDGTKKAASLLEQIAKEIDLSLYRKSKR